MVEEKRKLLNIRRMYIPDSGYIFLDVDLAGADAMVFAWQLGEGKFKTYMRSGVALHEASARFMFPKICSENPRTQPFYREVKSAGFAVNYGAGVPTLQENLGWSYRQADTFKTWWLKRFPEIPRFHKRVEMQLQETREVGNPFGYRIHFFEDPRSLLPEALAWVPQSTVACVTVKGALKLRRNIPRKFCRVAMQVHDSLILAIPYRERKIILEVRDILNSIIVPFPDPLKIPWNFKASLRSWGHVKKIENWDTLEIAA